MVTPWRGSGECGDEWFWEEGFEEDGLEHAHDRVYARIPLTDDGYGGLVVLV